MSENNKALLRRSYDAWNEQKMDEVASMIAPNFIDHAMPPEMAYGREGFLKARALGKTALADVHLQLEHVFAENDYVITHVIIHATHVGTYRSIPPTGKRFAMETISIMRLENEQLVEHWECSDFPGVMKQLGATIILENDTHA
jgi:predicted ester cyclase